jgi:gamma-glutamyltranspeptidase/glutathione hydrolase
MMPTIDIRNVEPVSVDAAHAFAEASKLAYADRNRYLADPDFVHVPVKKMLSPVYLEERSKRISADKTMGIAPAGAFEKEMDVATLLTTEEHPSTTHISVIDANGNAVAMTTSIEQGFGSGLSTRGFLLNNQLTDFSFSPTLPDGKTLHPNRVEPNKRPRSSMSPTMVFDKDNQLVMVIGSPGGARIIEYVLQTLVAVLDWDMNIQQAINMPHYLNMNGSTELESGTQAESLAEGLRARGHEVNIMQAPSGLHGITRFNGQLKGGADPRREGIAIGE